MAYYDAGYRPAKEFKSLNELLTMLVIEGLIHRYARVEHIPAISRHSTNEALNILSSTVEAVPHLKHLFKEAIKEIIQFEKEKQNFIQKLQQLLGDMS